ncbi:Der GTPase-activating protein YihI [Streptomyces sp. NBRC 110611]|nr:Der GTPase-activating protein YihI [Streptomyces sp. NBRC 110611]
MSALLAALVASAAVIVGISWVSATGLSVALAGTVAPVTARVRKPPVTPARSAREDAERRGFRWLGMSAFGDMGITAIRSLRLLPTKVCCATLDAYATNKTDF